MLKIVEIAWIVVAVISAIELVRLYNQPGDTKWYFGAFLLVAIFMYFFRRRTRLRYEAAKAKKEQEQKDNAE